MCYQSITSPFKNLVVAVSNHLLDWILVEKENVGYISDFNNIFKSINNYIIDVLHLSSAINLCFLYFE